MSCESLQEPYILLLMLMGSLSMTPLSMQLYSVHRPDKPLCETLTDAL